MQLMNITWLIPYRILLNWENGMSGDLISTTTIWFLWEHPCRNEIGRNTDTSTTVIAMTGFYSPETEARILECGALRCFAKPMEPSKLAEFIDSVFEQQATAARSRRRRPSRS